MEWKSTRSFKIEKIKQNKRKTTTTTNHHIWTNTGLTPKAILWRTSNQRLLSPPSWVRGWFPALKGGKMSGTDWPWPGLHLEAEKLCFAGNRDYLHDAQWRFLRRGCRSSTWTQQLGEGLQHVEVVGPVQGLRQRKTSSGATGLGSCCRGFNRKKTNLRQEL